MSIMYENIVLPGTICVIVALFFDRLSKVKNPHDCDFISLIDNLDDVWHKHEGKTCKIEVTFEPHEEE